MERRTLRRVDASPADVGRRLTLRYKTDPLGLGHAEAVGVLIRWSGTGPDGILMLRRRDETTVRVPFDAVEVARVLPPEGSAYRMQELAEATWPPLEHLDLGTWRLRWAGAKAGRANSVRVAGAPDRAQRAALAAVGEWYAERGAAPLLQIPSPSPYDEGYEDAGWQVVRRSRLMVAATQRLFISTGSGSGRSDLDIMLAESPDEEWLALLEGDDIGSLHDVRPILTAPQRVAFVSCRRSDTGELLGIGRGVLIGDWAGANNMVTAPAARRRGVATAIMAALVQWSHDEGAARWFLRVNADSEPAIALYDGIGFTRHHDYVYRAPQPVAESPVDRIADD
jgi:GNAT superfamily N-acetyltransferase